MPREVLNEVPEKKEGIEDAVRSFSKTELVDPDTGESRTLGDWLEYELIETEHAVTGETEHHHSVSYADVPDGEFETAMTWFQARLNERGFYILYADRDTETFQIANASLIDKRRER